MGLIRARGALIGLFLVVAAMLALRFLPLSRHRAANLPEEKQHRIWLATVSSQFGPGLRRLANEYEKLHPGISVKIQVLPVQGYETWIRTQIPAAGEQAPDIYNVNYTNDFYAKGLLATLTPFVNSKDSYTGQLWRKTLNAQFLERMKTEGEISSIPLDFIEVAFFYNKDIFNRLHLKPPHTWEQMIAMAPRIQRAGIIPFAVPGDADSYWSGTVGWIFRFFTDAYCRIYVPLVMAHPGDWDYSPQQNGHFKLNLANPYNDALVVLDNERILNAIKDGRIRMDSPRFVEAYREIKQFARYWEPGFNGVSALSAYQLFLTGKAAIMLNASTAIPQLMYDMADLYPSERFQWGIFPVPPLVHSRFHIPPFRGVGGPGVVFGVVKKSPAQVHRAVDFLMYITTPRAARVLVDEALKHRLPLNGPMLIPGVRFPPALAARFAPFLHRGFEKLDFRGLLDEQESTWQWTVWAQRYLEGKISVETCLRQYEKLMQEAVPRIAKAEHLDLNPRTKSRIP